MRTIDKLIIGLTLFGILATVALPGEAATLERDMEFMDNLMLLTVMLFGMAVALLIAGGIVWLFNRPRKRKPMATMKPRAERRPDPMTQDEQYDEATKRG